MGALSTQHGVVVAVDGSPPSDAAVGWAAREAVLRKRPLTIVHVIQLPVVRMWPEVPMPPELIDRLVKEGREILGEARRRAVGATESTQLTVETELATANVLPTLIDFSKKAEMIVVGSRGLGAVRGRLLGSVSRGLLQHARCPVAVVHGEEYLGRTEAPVVVGIDGSSASEAATSIAFDEAARRGVELVAVHSWSDFAVYELPGVEIDAVRAQAEQTLAERLAGWQERYPEVTVRRVVVVDRPTDQLLEQSERAQLVVVGSHGRGGFARMLLGSVSWAVAESARVPVIVARAD